MSKLTKLLCLVLAIMIFLLMVSGSIDRIASNKNDPLNTDSRRIMISNVIKGLLTGVFVILFFPKILLNFSNIKLKLFFSHAWAGFIILLIPLSISFINSDIFLFSAREWFYRLWYGQNTYMFGGLMIAIGLIKSVKVDKE